MRLNLLISIFGGILLTVVLYAVARALRRSNFWAAVLASGLPATGYAMYAASNWPGLDVLTLHLVTYPTVGVMLFQLYGQSDTQPGSAASPSGGHWAPKLLVAFFVFITVLYAGFVYVAGHGLPQSMARWLLPDTGGRPVHTGFSGVVAHGEGAAKSIAYHRRMDAMLTRLGWRVEVSGLDALTPERAGEVRVWIHGRDGRPVGDARVSIELGHPGQAPARRDVLAFSADGGYRALIGLPGPGAWVAGLVLEHGDERIRLEREVGGESVNEKSAHDGNP